MSLKEKNLRFLVVNEIKKTLEAAVKDERASHLKDLLEMYDEVGTKQFDVSVDGRKLGRITLTASKESWDVDNVTLLDWAKKSDLQEVLVEEVVIPPIPEQRYHQLREQSVNALLGKLDWVEVGAPVVLEDGTEEKQFAAVHRETGEVVPGVVYRPSGRPSTFSAAVTDKAYFADLWQTEKLQGYLSPLLSIEAKK